MKSELVTLTVPDTMTVATLAGLCRILTCRLVQEDTGTLYIVTSKDTRIELALEPVKPG